MNASNLFNQVVDLTAIRDVELLEHSLLGTLYEYLKPLDLRIFRIDSDGVLMTQIAYNQEQARAFNQEDRSLDPVVEKMLAHMKAHEITEHTEPLDAGFLTLYGLHKTTVSSLYMQVLNHDRLSRENRHLLLGMLQIFKNYIGLLADNITDPLTGLLNRKSFDHAMEKVYQSMTEKAVAELDTSIEVGDRRRSGAGEFWLAMLDIDHFKAINDTYGHVYGDDVLILLSQILRSSFRDDDLLFRFGGEEFVLLIRCDGSDNARIALQRLLDRVAAYNFPRVERVTISAGVVAIDRQTFSGTLLDYADQALYASKENGRNQVTFFEDMVAAGATERQQISTGGIELF
ncbi:MAG: GGDEF domain-containing protein [Pseudomonadota bacterium]